MTIHELAETYLTQHRMERVQEAADALGVHPEGLTESEVLDHIIRANALDKIESWSFEDLWGYTYDSPGYDLVIITSCKNGNLIEELINVAWSGEDPTCNASNSIEEILRKHDYVAIVGCKSYNKFSLQY